MKKFFKIMNASGYVLSSKYEISAERVLGYGGVWCKDHRNAKRFYSMKDVKQEINRIPYSGKFLIVESGEDWKKEYERNREKLNR